jgi:hypothetical protein
MTDLDQALRSEGRGWRTQLDEPPDLDQLIGEIDAGRRRVRPTRWLLAVASVAAVITIAMLYVATRPSAPPAAAPGAAGQTNTAPAISPNASAAQSRTATMTAAEIALATRAALQEAAFTTPGAPGTSISPTSAASNGASPASRWPSNVTSVEAVSVPLSDAGPLVDPSGDQVPGHPDERVVVIRMTGTFVVGDPAHRSSGPVLSLVVRESSGESIGVVVIFHPSTLPALPNPTVIFQR